MFRTLFPHHYFPKTVTINYHHLAASRSVSVDDDEEEEDRLNAMLSMISSRNLTAPKMMKGFYPTSLLNLPTSCLKRAMFPI